MRAISCLLCTLKPFPTYAVLPSSPEALWEHDLSVHPGDLITSGYAQATESNKTLYSTPLQGSSTRAMIVRLVKIEFSKLLAERTSRNSVESQSQGKIVRRLSKKLRVSSNRKLPNSYNSDFMSMRPSSPVLLTRGHHFGTILEDAEGQEPYIAPLEYTPSCSCMDMKPDYLKEKHSLSYEIWLHFGKSGKRQVRSGKDRSHISYYRKIHGKPLEGGELVWLWSSAIQDDEVTARRFTGIGKGLAYQILKSSLM
eukprot:Em0003g1706a